MPGGSRATSASQSPTRPRPQAGLGKQPESPQGEPDYLAQRLACMHARAIAALTPRHLTREKPRLVPRRPTLAPLRMRPTPPIGLLGRGLLSQCSQPVCAGLIMVAAAIVPPSLQHNLKLRASWPAAPSIP
jgi:hypothetical protein